MNINRFVKDYAPIALGREMTQEELNTIIELACKLDGFHYEGLHVDLDGVFIDKDIPKRSVVTPPTPVLQLLGGLFVKLGFMTAVKQTVAMLDFLSNGGLKANAQRDVACC